MPLKGVGRTKNLGGPLPKSMYRSRAGRHFCGTENEIWAGFGLVAVLKKMGTDYEQLLRVFFSCFQGQKKS